MEIDAIIKGFAGVPSLLKLLGELIKGSRGARRSLLLELQNNLRLILLHTQEGVPIDKVIAKLDATSFHAALRSDFNFNTLKRSRVGKALTGNIGYYRRYEGWTTEQLFTQVYAKIQELKAIIELDPDNARVRKDVRLRNVLRLMLLLLKHLKS